MRILFLCLGLSILLFSKVQGQKRVYDNIRFGTRFGINVSGLNGDFSDSLNVKYKVGFHGGVYSNIKLTEKIAFGMELLVSREGYKADVLDTFNIVNIYVHNVYQFEIPVLVDIKIADQWDLQVGGAYATTLWEDKVNFPDLNPYREYQNDFTAILGLNYQIDPVNDFGIRYNYGLNTFVETATKSGSTSNVMFVLRVRIL